MKARVHRRTRAFPFLRPFGFLASGLASVLIRLSCPFWPSNEPKRLLQNDFLI
jgi:hypothetical protein